MYKKIRPGMKIQKSKVKLSTYSGERLKVIGKAVESAEYKDKFYTLEFLIVDQDQAQPILGIQACDEMQLIKRINSVKKEESIFDEFPEVFNGVGCLKGEHKIKVDASVPPVIAPPRRVAAAVRDSLKEGLDKLEKMEIIRRIEEPTDWCSNPLG